MYQYYYKVSDACSTKSRDIIGGEKSARVLIEGITETQNSKFRSFTPSLLMILYYLWVINVVIVIPR